jgi:1,5-anhydro-D-fructose reductase (1,5-anhydro-D-mannitol-forming)
MTVRWGFVGASIWARTHMIPAVQAVEDADAVGLFSTSIERGERLAREAGLERAYSSLDALLGDPTIDAVYVSTTNDLHAAQTIAAARAGKHVLCEKPLALSLSDALDMREACLDAGVVLGVNHHLRGAATVRAMRDLVAQGAIGEIVAGGTFHTTLLPEAMRTWRLNRAEAGAGAILDLTVHDVDTIRFLLADEVAEVTAVTANQGMGQGTIEDSAMGVLRMRDGQLVSFHDAFTVPHAGTRIELHGTTGSLFGRDVMNAEPIGEVFLRRANVIERVDVPSRWPLYENVIRHFDAAVRGDGRPLASSQDGIASLAVALAALESARRGVPVTPAEWGRDDCPPSP